MGPSAADSSDRRHVYKADKDEIAKVVEQLCNGKEEITQQEFIDGIKVLGITGQRCM